MRVPNTIHKIRANVISFGEAATLSRLFKDQQWTTHYVKSPFDVELFQIVDNMPNVEDYEQYWGERKNGENILVGADYLYSHVRIRGNYIKATRVSHGFTVDGEINGELVESEYYNKKSFQIAVFYVENANRYLVATKKVLWR